jgi:hypothetical protein
LAQHRPSYPGWARHCEEEGVHERKPLRPSSETAPGRHAEIAV